MTNVTKECETQTAYQREIDRALQARRLNLVKARAARNPGARASLSQTSSPVASSPKERAEEEEADAWEPEPTPDTVPQSRPAPVGDEMAPPHSLQNLLVGLIGALLTRLAIEYTYPRLRHFMLGTPSGDSPETSPPTESKLVRRGQNSANTEFMWHGQTIFRDK